MDSDTLKILKVMLKLDGATVDPCKLDRCESGSLNQSSGRLFRIKEESNYYFEPCLIHLNGWINCTLVKEIKGEDDR